MNLNLLIRIWIFSVSGLSAFVNMCGFLASPTPFLTIPEITSLLLTIYITTRFKMRHYY